MSTNHLLKNIYKASQCTDINDCLISLNQLQEVKKYLNNKRGASRAVYIREASIVKKMNSLIGLK